MAGSRQPGKAFALNRVFSDVGVTEWRATAVGLDYDVERDVGGMGMTGQAAVWKH